MSALKRSFYNRPTVEVARALLGHLLVRSEGGRLLVGRIVETEAYVGEEDPACHAARGRTARNEVMYGPPGYSYVYFTYGMHHCLNAVTEREGYPAAVLLRAVEPLAGVERMCERRGIQRSGEGAAPDPRIASGPARLAQAFGLTREHSRLDLTRDDGALRIERAGPRRRERVGVSGRIGISVARETQWRFFIEGNVHVSRGPRAAGEGRDS
ncbi:MAG: DNA-3-methyladenine glycosylase [Candidatus Eisenbacteria bacterium]|nr:DNA-3-methyladenine glycosylase [Candidatus Eisenbacteria bacterium]